jgi:hypothetical protein
MEAAAQAASREALVKEVSDAPQNEKMGREGSELIKLILTIRQ